MGLQQVEKPVITGKCIPAIIFFPSSIIVVRFRTENESKTSSMQVVQVPRGRSEYLIHIGSIYSLVRGLYMVCMHLLK